MKKMSIHKIDNSNISNNENANGMKSDEIDTKVPALLLFESTEFI